MNARGSSQVVLFQKPSCYHDGHSHLCLGVLRKIIVTQHCLPLHQEMALEIVLCKEAFINFTQKRCWVLWTQSHGPKNSLNVFSGQTVHISACFWEKRMSDFTSQRWKRPSRLLSTKSAKTSLCDGMGVHQCPRHGWSACMWRYHWYGGLCWNFGETCAAVKMTFPRNSMSIHI